MTSSPATVDDVADLLAGRRVVALSGAGLSTDSGIPDYRGPGSPPRSPMTCQEFVSGLPAQQRYWARSHLGWRTMGEARPNDGHRALTALEVAGVVSAVITQNVNALHQKAGSRSVVNLHGQIADVVCLRCGDRSRRAYLAERLGEANPGFGSERNALIAPDGDAMLTDVSGFRVLACQVCDGTLKPDVVFFGENVPRDRVERCYALVAEAQALLRPGRRGPGAARAGVVTDRAVRLALRPACAPALATRRHRQSWCNEGRPLADLRVDAGCSPTLCALVERLGAATVASCGPSGLSQLSAVHVGRGGSPVRRTVRDRAPRGTSRDHRCAGRWRRRTGADPGLHRA